MPTDFAKFGAYLIDACLRHKSERILDVGCGSSPHRLAAFKRCGFAELTGVDPFIDADTQYHGIPVYRRTINQVKGEFGMIMFHHSLEHVPDPVAALRVAARLLTTGGTCLVRIPVMGTHLWREFGVNWSELDAPRHLHLMSTQTMNALAQITGFRIRKIQFDSQGWEIAASYQYQADIPLRDAHSFSQEGQHSMFSAARLQEFEAEAEQLNRRSDGGRACFYLEKT
jgi:ubiquinone/menaquinone biosynthesis C-methylase UbiE